MQRSFILALLFTAVVFAVSVRTVENVIEIPAENINVEVEIPEDDQYCDPDVIQDPCAGDILIKTSKPGNDECDEYVKVKYGFITAYVCIKCPYDSPIWAKDMYNCPYFTCSGAPICGRVEAYGQKADLTPTQMKCLYETRDPQGCGF